MYEWGKSGDVSNVIVERIFDAVMALCLCCNLFLALFGAWYWIYSINMASPSHESYMMESIKPVSPSSDGFYRKPRVDWASIGGIFEFESSSTRDNPNHHNCLLDWLCGFQHIMRSYGGVRSTRDVSHATNSVGGDNMV